MIELQSGGTGFSGRDGDKVQSSKYAQVRVKQWGGRGVRGFVTPPPPVPSLIVPPAGPRLPPSSPCIPLPLPPHLHSWVVAAAGRTSSQGNTLPLIPPPLTQLGGGSGRQDLRGQHQGPRSMGGLQFWN